MEISIEKIVSNKELTRMAAKHLEYSLKDVNFYEELTEEERQIISPNDFRLIKGLTREEKYQKMKKDNPNCLIIMRCGDMHELRGEDAKFASHVLGIVLSRHTFSGQLYAAFPHTALDTYLPKLVRAGKKVAMFDLFA